MFLRAVLLAIGGACVLLGVVLLFSWFGQSRQAPGQIHMEARDPRTPVLAAAHAITRGALLKQGDFVPKTLKADEHILPGSLAAGQEGDFAGAMARRDFAAGEPLIASEFIKPDDRAFLAAALRPGFRATSIFVDAAQSVAGLTMPGDFVDVLLVQSFDDPARKAVSETVLRGVRVLAVDQSMNATSRAVTPEAHVPKTVTLEVTERQAKTLQLASKLGSFELSLLPLDAVAEVDSPAGRPGSGPVWASDVSPALGEVAKTRPKSAAQAAPACPPVTGSTLDKSVRCVPSRLAPRPAPAASDSTPDASGQEQPAVRAAPAGEGGIDD